MKKKYLEVGDSVFCTGAILSIKEGENTQDLEYDNILDGAELTFNDTDAPVHYDFKKKKYYVNTEDL